ncbi:TPA_asm: hypothetical protein GHI96_14840 [Listeria monocytogenes]|uniref:AbrB/MazE/SpoVT family DNA-binding domain-containing protein n=1 Tax=Enterococcus TaxID=1350 RepID=UPI000CF1A2BD|nr:MULTISPECIES: AbrB/MazE/SpoVT family DNA-binding domain-containing protein [Enterococcus]EAE3519185.1 hypothetical protein [Listeria monocytogenes]EAF2251738.1 hypothetical protein [Listeria monocytogenes]EAF6366790.1 hypothetical protein [Listeria monocytogenes]MDG4581508.1 hypothetical protein [Enterococcus faecium]MDT2383085.1 hypothetical protein [Enterococcus avium]
MEVVKVSKWGNSSAIRIPKSILKRLNISLDQNASNVEFELHLNENNQIVLTPKDQEEGYLQTLFKNYEVSDFDKVRFDWGEPRGHEIL